MAEDFVLDDNCTHDCSTCGADCSEEYKNAQSASPRLSHTSSAKKIIMVASHKGGVGKSFVASLLATELKNKGYKVGILDADVLGASISTMSGVDEEPSKNLDGLCAVESHFGIYVISTPMLLGNPSAPITWGDEGQVNVAKQFYSDIIWGDLDYIIIDTPSALTPITSFYFGIKQIDAVLVVTDPSELTNVIASKTLNLAKIQGKKILGLVKNYCDRPSLNDLTAFIAKTYETQILDELSFDKDLYIMANNGSIGNARTNMFENTIKAIEEL